MPKQKWINIYEYSNYREFLRDYYRLRKDRDKKFSYRAFSKAAGFSTPNFYKLVSEGKRNLSQESIEKFAKGLELNKAETTYFENLVHVDQAKSTKIKAEHYAKLSTLQGYRQIRQLEKDEYEYYKRWYYPVVRELVNLRQFKEDPKWITRALGKQITNQEAEQALRFLLNKGYIERDPNGRLQTTTQDIASGPIIRSITIRRFHQTMAEKAKDAIDTPPAERDFSGLTMPVAGEEYEQLMADIKSFRKMLLKKYRNKKTKNIVCQLNLQLFKLADTLEAT